MKNKFIGLIVLSIILILFLLQWNNIQQLYFEQSMKMPLTVINQNKMTMVDQETRFDSAVLSTNKTVEYEFTFVNRDSSAIDVPEIKKKVYLILNTNIKNDPGFEILRDKNANITFIYRDKRGVKVFHFIFKPEDYKKPE